MVFFIDPNIHTYMNEIFPDNVLYYDHIMDKFNENFKDNIHKLYFNIDLCKMPVFIQLNQLNLTDCRNFSSVNKYTENVKKKKKKKCHVLYFDP